MFTKVLVPLDGSETAHTILPHISMVARGLNISVVALGVADGHEQPAMGQHLKDAVDKLAALGTPASSILTPGRPAEEILKAAEKEGCDVIALMTHTRGTSATGVIGRVTAAVLKANQMPTLVVPPRGVPRPISSIVVSLDGSTLAEAVLPYLEELASRLDVEAALIRVVQTGAAYATAMDAYAAAANLAEAAEAETEAYLGEVSERLRTVRVRTSTSSLRGAPWEILLRYGRAHPDALMIMTARGRSGLARWLLGSVTEQVVKSAGSSVLVVPHRYGERYAKSLTDLLEQTPLFAHMRPDDLKELDRLALTRQFKAGEVIVEAADEATGMFVIGQGDVEVARGAGSASPTVLARLSSGDFFGEMSMLDNQPRSATGMARTDVECISITRADFLGQVQGKPEIALAMLPVLIKRLREANAAVRGGPPLGSLAWSPGAFVPSLLNRSRPDRRGGGSHNVPFRWLERAIRPLAARRPLSPIWRRWC